MNPQFYEFLGQVFLNAARSQDSFEAMLTWMKQGFPGFSPFTEHFRHCYGLQSFGGDSKDASPAWQKAITDFQQALVQFAGQWGWISQNEHQQLVDKCAELEKKVAEQQATITQLRGLLAQKGIGYTELFEHFNTALKDQGRQLQTLMESLRGAPDKSS